jgi:hypothetical protein
MDYRTTVPASAALLILVACAPNTDTGVGLGGHDDAYKLPLCWSNSFQVGNDGSNVVELADAPAPADHDRWYYNMTGQVAHSGSLVAPDDATAQYYNTGGDWLLGYGENGVDTQLAIECGEFSVAHAAHFPNGPGTAIGYVQYRLGPVVLNWGMTRRFGGPFNVESVVQFGLCAADGEQMMEAAPLTDMAAAEDLITAYETQGEYGPVMNELQVILDQLALLEDDAAFQAVLAFMRALTVDTDEDGLSDRVEECTGTSVTDPDMDDDGVPDGYEEEHASAVHACPVFKLEAFTALPPEAQALLTLLIASSANDKPELTLLEALIREGEFDDREGAVLFYAFQWLAQGYEPSDDSAPDVAALLTTLARYLKTSDLPKEVSQGLDTAGLVYLLLQVLEGNALRDPKDSGTPYDDALIVGPETALCEAVVAELGDGAGVNALDCGATGLPRNCHGYVQDRLGFAEWREKVLGLLGAVTGDPEPDTVTEGVKRIAGALLKELLMAAVMGGG